MKFANNPYQEYQNNNVQTADQKQLIIMLYEGAIRFLEQAVGQMADFRSYDKANTNIIKAQDIITELMVSLDMEKGGEVAQNLMNLYAFMKKELLEANVKKEPRHAQNVIRYLSELLSAWKQIDVNKPADKAAKPGDYKGFAAQG